MRVFVTGASGWIGGAVVAELTREGHDVVGLVRSADGEQIVRARGALALRGDLEDLAGLSRAARDAEAVIHLGFVHDFSRMEDAAAIDRRAIETFADALAGTNRTLLIASGVAGLSRGRAASEDDEPPAGHPRVANAAFTLSLVARDITPVVVRLPPTVHGTGDRGFVARLVAIARERGVSGYVGEGSNEWSAVHRDDAARAIVLALSSSRRVVHAVAEEGIATKDIARVIGEATGVPVASFAPESAGEHFGWLGNFFAMDARALSDATRRDLAWEPREIGLLEDIERGHYSASERL